MRLPHVWTAPGPDEHEQVLEAVQLSATVSGKDVTVEGVHAAVAMKEPLSTTQQVSKAPASGVLGYCCKGMVSLKKISLSRANEMWRSPCASNRNDKLTLLVPMVTEDVTKPCPPSSRGYSSLASTSASGSSSSDRKITSKWTA